MLSATNMGFDTCPIGWLLSDRLLRFADAGDILGSIWCQSAGSWQAANSFDNTDFSELRLLVPFEALRTW
jgi:hypothetical protein